MNRFNIFCVCAVALIASSSVFAYSSQGGYSSGGSGSNYGSGSDSGYYGSDAASAGSQAEGNVANSAAAGGPSDASSSANAGPSSYGNNYNVPYAPVNTRGNTVTSSISYPQNKGEILIHRPAPIIVKRPPTKVLVNHPPLVVKPAPVVLHKPPAVVVRKVYVKHHPRPVKVEPVYVNVVKPPAEKYFVKEQQQHYNGPQVSPVSAGYAPGAGFGGAFQGASGFSGASGAYDGSVGQVAAGPDSAATNAGYKLMQGDQAYSVLAGIGGASYGQSGDQYNSGSGY